MSEILQQIIRSHKTCYFVSPHFDDAAYSAGSLMSELSKTNKVIAINIFTQEPTTKPTLSAKQYLRNCSYDSAKELYIARTIEDKSALSSINVETINLGFTEALWRQKPAHKQKLLSKLLPELGVIYPTYRFHIISGRIAREDKVNLRKIRYKLSRIIDKDSSVVFCPLGVGKHVDHVITRKACDGQYDQVLHWADYPYSLKDISVITESQPIIVFTKNKSTKLQLIKKYKSQFKPIFNKVEAVKVVDERFY